MSDSELKSRILYLHDALRKLAVLSRSSKEEFVQDFRISDAVLHNLQVAIESLTDIGNYILRRGGHKIPQTRAEVFQLLCRHEYLKPHLEQEMLLMARFRNLLVHAYASIDLSQVYEILDSRLDLLRLTAASLIDASESISSDSD